MKDIEKIAGELYETYCLAVGGVAFNGDALPTWEEFGSDSTKTKQSNAWRAVAKISGLDTSSILDDVK